MESLAVDMYTLDTILDVITSDANRNSLLEVLYADDLSIDKSMLLNYVKECMSSVIDNKILKLIQRLETTGDEYTYFIIRLQEKIVSQITDDLGKAYSAIEISSIEYFTFWAMYAVAIKKCIGIEHAEKNLSSSLYFQAIPGELNESQRNSHNECLDSFNMNANKFGLKRTPELRLFLHSFHSKNKSLKTRKKNLHRVERRAKKIVQVNKLTHKGKTMFSNKRYLVPGQFAAAIQKLYLH